MKTEGLYEAMLARDSRFDGRFFVGVRTTGIYCRPICPARPKRENVEFFRSAAGAERAGYRPCARCHPEAAPLSAVWHGRSAVVQRALRVIATHGIEGGEEKFAGQFGMTARHLRRLFMADVGQTPKQIVLARRLDFARKLVGESRLPMSTVAETAGFSSVRRFNDAFRDRFKRTPSLVRGRGGRGDGTAVELSLSYRPPMDWNTLLEFFRTHHLPGVEAVVGAGFERVFRLKGSVGWLRVEPVAGRHELKLSVVTS